MKLFSELDEIASSEIILASSTSAIPPSKFTESLKGRNRCIVAHPVRFFSAWFYIFPTDQSTTRDSAS